MLEQEPKWRLDWQSDAVDVDARLCGVDARLCGVDGVEQKGPARKRRRWPKFEDRVLSRLSAYSYPVPAGVLVDPRTRVPAVRAALLKLEGRGLVERCERGGVTLWWRPTFEDRVLSRLGEYRYPVPAGALMARTRVPAVRAALLKLEGRGLVMRRERDGVTMWSPRTSSSQDRWGR